MVSPFERKSVLCLLVLIVFSFHLSPNTSVVAGTTGSDSIELEDFHWNKFPLTVLVNMNEWSNFDYAVNVHAALDNWVKSIWNYTHTYSNMTLMFNYLFYVSDVNSTGSYDIIISFSQNEFSQNAVGLTTFIWNSITHTPITPILINITTYSATADNLFVKNVAMHELGHAFGLGHANSPDTTNGPELMYFASSLKQKVYPSTLDVYGLTMLYDGHFSQTVQLPFNIPYIMLAEGILPSQDQPFPLNLFYVLVNELKAFFTRPQVILSQPRILFVPSILWMMIALFSGLLFRSESKASLVSIIVLIFSNYIILFNGNPVSFSLVIILLVPSILAGAFIGGFLGRKIVRNNDELLKP